MFFPPNLHLHHSISEAEGFRDQQWNFLPKMTTSMAKQQEIYNQQGFLSALPVLNETELKEAKRAFSELEKELSK